MKNLILISLLIISVINYIISIYFIGGSVFIGLLSFLFAFFVWLILQITNLNPLKSNWNAFIFMVLANVFITGGIILTHSLEIFQKLLYSPSKSFIEKQKKYKKLLS